MAHGAFRGRHEIEQIFAIGIGSGGFEILFEVSQNSQKTGLAAALRLAVQQKVLNLVRKFLIGRRQVETVGLNQQLDTSNKVLR